MCICDMFQNRQQPVMVKDRPAPDFSVQLTTRFGGSALVDLVENSSEHSSGH
jgi:hypothetical protein